MHGTGIILLSAHSLAQLQASLPCAARMSFLKLKSDPTGDCLKPPCPRDRVRKSSHNSQTLRRSGPAALPSSLPTISQLGICASPTPDYFEIPKHITHCLLHSTNIQWELNTYQVLEDEQNKSKSLLSLLSADCTPRFLSNSLILWSSIWTYLFPESLLFL